MAIDAAALEVWGILKEHLPKKPAVLEIGQANWYDDTNIEAVPELAGLGSFLKGVDYFELAQLFYLRLFDYEVLDAVDMNGTARAWQYDLNYPLPLQRRYDIVIDSGTTEHVFDQRQVFESIHDWTVPGGLMVHAFPIGGCKDHGFYTHQPCLLRDVGLANGYETLAAVRSEYGDDTILHLAWRKVGDAPFRVPHQNGYASVMGGTGVSETPMPPAQQTNRRTPSKLKNQQEDQSMSANCNTTVDDLFARIGRMTLVAEKSEQLLAEANAKFDALLRIAACLRDGGIGLCQLDINMVEKTFKVMPKNCCEEKEPCCG